VAGAVFIAHCEGGDEDKKKANETECRRSSS
jgi:hypothetical protein